MARGMSAEKNLKWIFNARLQSKIAMIDSNLALCTHLNTCGRGSSKFVARGIDRVIQLH